MDVLPGSVTLPGGRSIPINLDPVRQPPQHRRRLNAVAVTRGFAPLPDAEQDVLIEVIDDISGSMTGGNDATGLRHEALLILLEYIGRNTRRRRRRPTRWHFSCRTFDNGGSCLDIGRTPLDRAHLARIQAALLGQTFGGSSNLGPALAASIAEAADWSGTHVRVVMSDFELFDPQVPAVLADFAAAPADLNMACVFRSAPPVELDGTDVVVHHIDPAEAEPAAVAALLHAEIQSLLSPRDAHQASARAKWRFRT